MVVLGIHGGITLNQHDAGATLLVGGSAICSVEEERLVRVKGAQGYLPIQSIKACLADARIELNQVDLIATSGSTYEDHAERTREWLQHHFGTCPRIRTYNHQECHIAAGFYNSGFDEALCLSYDFSGDSLSGMLAIAERGKTLTVIRKNDMDLSLGLFYATITSFLGFKPGEDEYKIMGLAPYGRDTIDMSKFLNVDHSGFLVNRDCYTTRKSA